MWGLSSWAAGGSCLLCRKMQRQGMNLLVHICSKWSSTTAERGGELSWARNECKGSTGWGNKWEGKAGQHLTGSHPVAMKHSNESLCRHFQERNALSASFWALFLKARSLSRGKDSDFQVHELHCMQEITGGALPLFLLKALGNISQDFSYLIKLFIGYSCSGILFTQTHILPSSKNL